MLSASLNNSFLSSLPHQCPGRGRVVVLHQCDPRHVSLRRGGLDCYFDLLLETTNSQIIRRHNNLHNGSLFLTPFHAFDLFLTPNSRSVLRDGVSLNIYSFCFLLNIYHFIFSSAVERRREMIYLTTHSTHFIYSYMASKNNMGMYCHFIHFLFNNFII